MIVTSNDAADHEEAIGIELLGQHGVLANGCHCARPDALMDFVAVVSVNNLVYQSMSTSASAATSYP